MCCRKLLVGRNALVNCLFLSWTCVGDICSAYTSELSAQSMWAQALALSFLLNF